ncbi:neprilysin-11-like [Venturia canescens]|uniref:neprilysin-11-like n=1 Tax=Venturia canescens TaxID=32260 RepID=UPI001C9CCEF7|nr:neprilysin-11-like [Venturia canescens]
MKAFKISVYLGLWSAISLARSNRIPLLNQSGIPPENDKFDVAVEQSDKASDYKVCRTEECKKIADEFLSSMNRTADPCDNFYDFVCGGWTEDLIPEGSQRWDRSKMFQKLALRRIRQIMETEPEPTDILPVRQAKKFYRSCMDTETRDRRGIKPIETILLRRGGWPIAKDEEEGDSNERNWQEVADSYVRLTGSHVFYRITVADAVKGATSSEINIEPQNLPLAEYVPLEYRNYRSSYNEKYKDLVAGVARMFIEDSRADVSTGKLFKDANDIVEFEKQIHELTENGDAEEMTLQEFDKWYKQKLTETNVDEKRIMDWQSSMQSILDIANLKVDPSGAAYLPNLNYIAGLGKLLEKTPTRTIVNYIHWHFVANMLRHTSEDAMKNLQAFLMEARGMEERPPRWEECIGDTIMSHVNVYVFVGKYLEEETESAVTKMAENIRREMNKEIEEATWLDEKSRSIIKEKLRDIKILIGSPDWYKDKKKVIEFYRGWIIGNEYFENTLNSMRFTNKKLLSSYTYATTTTKESELWSMLPTIVNAQYLPSENEINVPAAIIQPPLFTPHIPDNVKYGSIGAAMGHEIGHAFDNSGIRYGNTSKLSVSAWKYYYERAECFVDQFNKYYEHSVSAEATKTMQQAVRSAREKSEHTLAENIADTVGIQAAFEAYKKLEKSGRSVRLEGLEDFTDDQLFFVSFAASWCTIGTPEYEEKEKKSDDEHSPPNLRVIASVSNTKGFAEAFKCPAGSPMNPDTKCSVWEELTPEPEKPACIQKGPSR